MSTGMALEGFTTITMYPRFDFFILACNQLINHLDKIPIISDYNTKVIIRTGIGSERPLHPQFQHIGDYTDSFILMCPNLEVIRLNEPEDIFPAYEKALNRSDGKSTILVEWGDYYVEK